MAQAWLAALGCCLPGELHSSWARAKCCLWKLEHGIKESQNAFGLEKTFKTIQFHPPAKGKDTFH